MRLADLHTIVHDDDPTTPVMPYDCNSHEDQGMLVYGSEDAARASCEHQSDLYGIVCHPVRLVDFCKE